MCLSSSLLSYLTSDKTFPGGRRDLFSWSIFLLWIGCIIAVSMYHELWRDEVRALSIALGPESFLDLPAALKNEGHPLLWYVILRGGYVFFQNTLVLKITSIVVAIISVFLFLRFAPFPVWLKFLFLGSVLPAYEYSVMCRNYGISMLFMFSFAAYYKRKQEMPIRLALFLVALAHTNIHSTILGFFLAAYWFYDEYVIVDYNGQGKHPLVRLFPFALVAFGVISAIYIIIPDENSIVRQSQALTPAQILKDFWHILQHPGANYDTIFWGFSPWLRDLLMWIFFLGLFIRPLMALAFFGAASVLSLFFAIGYSGALRHQGVFFIYLITIYWIVFAECSQRKVPSSLWTVHKSVVYIILPLILVIHLALAYMKICRDLTEEMSSSRAFGHFITAHQEYAQAIIIGEPDLRLESLPYYVDNRIYLPREKRFSRYVKLTCENSQEMSLAELLAVAQSLKISERKPILIALGHFGLREQESPPFTRSEQYNKQFTWTKEDLEVFHASTDKISEFKQDVENERYEVYRLK